MMVLSLTGWAWSARVIRIEVAIYRERDFVRAAQARRNGPPQDYPFGHFTQHAVLTALDFHRCSHLCHRRTSGIGVPWPRRCQCHHMGHQPVLGQQRCRTPDRFLVDICAHRSVHALVAFSLTLIGYGMDEVNNPRLQSTRLWKKRVPTTARPDWTEVRRESLANLHSRGVIHWGDKRQHCRQRSVAEYSF